MSTSTSRTTPDPRIDPSHPLLPDGYDWRAYEVPVHPWSYTHRRSGIYVAVGPDLTLYVGQTRTVHERIGNHRSDPWFRLFAQVIGEPTFYWAPVPHEDLNREERKLIDMLAPRLNVIRAPLIRAPLIDTRLARTEELTEQAEREADQEYEGRAAAKRSEIEAWAADLYARLAAIPDVDIEAKLAAHTAPEQPAA